jgi:UDP-N-acetylglucosamine diphosphorylase/glucosamine-1-phosphate N-acetyltransferase
VKCGILSLLDKILLEYGAAASQLAAATKSGAEPQIILSCRGLLKTVVQERYPAYKTIESDGTPSFQTAARTIAKPGAAYLFINGRLLAEAGLAKKIPLTGPEEVFVCNGVIVAARLSAEKSSDPSILSALGILPQKQSKRPNINLPQIKTTKINVKLIDYPWQLIKENSAQIEADYRRIFKKGKGEGKEKGIYKKIAIHKDVTFYKRENVIIGNGAAIEALVVIDARSGPVIIDENAHIMPLTYIAGPCYVGKNTTILGAQIREGTSIGPNCKVHGEVSNSIFHGCSNKAHYGFLGHSYVCEWVNLGAGTTNSNLKNNYGSVKMWNDGKLIDTGEQFVGCVIGDHTKTAIGTLINTGTVISIFCNIFEGMPPKYVPPFSFGMKHQFDLEKAIAIAQTAASRRGTKFSQAEIDLFRKT